VYLFHTKYTTNPLPVFTASFKTEINIIIKLNLENLIIVLCTFFIFSLKCVLLTVGKHSMLSV